jgi:nucleotide-binding universal stress UspA family protein
MTGEALRRILVVANETVAGRSLLDTLRDRAEAAPIAVTVLCPINQPRKGYLVYEDTRRAAAGRRLERTLQALRDAEIPAHGSVVDADPIAVVRDAIAQEGFDEIVVSTHPRQQSAWVRRNVLEKIRSVTGGLPVEHVVVDLDAESREANVLVVANETVLGEPLLERIRERAARSPASFLILCPQSDPTQSAHPEAERRLRRALAILRSEGLEVHGQVAHPDPYTAALHAVHDERTDEIIVSTFPGERGSSWLRRDLVERLRKETGLRVEHVVVDRQAVESPA